nr:hypothetical protein MF5293_00902 [Mycoplasma feriruminatoris]
MKIQNSKDYLKEQVEQIKKQVDPTVVKTNDIIENIKTSVIKVVDINKLMLDWKNEKSNSRKKAITNKIRDNDLEKLKQAYDKIVGELGEVQKFGKQLETIVNDFNKKFDDKFFELEK